MKLSVRITHTIYLTIALLAVLWVVACSSAAPSPEPTTQAKILSFAQTATVRAGEAAQSGLALATAQAQATGTAVRQEAIVTSQNAAATRDLQATESAWAPILAELPLYGITGPQGYLLWQHPPVTLELDGFRSFDFANEFPTLSARDFVIAADITWDTQYGASGCGFALRMNGETQSADGYLVILSRNSNGHAYFTALADGKPANYRNYYANGLDPAFAWGNGSANRLAVVAQGEKLWVYTNYTLLGEIDTGAPPPPTPDLPNPPPRPERPNLAGHILKNKADELELGYQKLLVEYQAHLEEYQQMVAEIQEAHTAALNTYRDTESVYSEGFAGLVAFSYSGATSCEFTDAWLWSLEP